MDSQIPKLISELITNNSQIPQILDYKDSKIHKQAYRTYLFLYEFFACISLNKDPDRSLPAGNNDSVILLLVCVN